MSLSEAFAQVLIFAAIGCYGAWLASTRGATWLYSKSGSPDAFMWFWLRLLGIPRTERNCRRFVQILGGLLLAIAATGTVIVLILGVASRPSG